MGKLSKDLAKSIRDITGHKTSAYDTTATVQRIEGGTAWVHIPGGVDETPVQMTIDTSPGDTVQLRVSGGKAWIVGNASAPPTDDRTAIYARETASNAHAAATTAQETAEEAETTAESAQTTANAILIYDHGYSLASGIATFQAYLYRGGVDVHTQYSPKLFRWYLKTEDGTEPIIVENDEGTTDNYGYTCTVNVNSCGYGAEVIGTFTDTADADLLSSEDDIYTTSDDTTITVRADGEKVRISDLTVSTTLYGIEKFLVVGTEGEHLITVDTLQDYLNANLEKQVKFDTTANWNAQTTLVSDASTLYIYTDYQTDSSGNKVAGIKAGDGNAYVVDLPFTDAIAMEHIEDTTVHITAAERAAWNNKVRCYYASGDELIFTTA